MRSSRVILVGLSAVVGLSACGLRGGLQRPDPIFRDVAPIEQTMEDELEAVEPEPEVSNVNEFGGEVPDAAPVSPVEETAIEDAGEGE
ncbi:MAG: lipoprotein [Pseudomonadota bacterium]